MAIPCWSFQGNNVVRIGINDSPPYVRVRQDVKPDGFTYEVLNEAARRRGVRLQWTVAPEGPDAALRSGKVDVWPVVTDLPERHKYMQFTDAWLFSKYILLVPEKTPEKALYNKPDRRITYRNSPSGPGGLSLPGTLAGKFFPNARLVPQESGKELLMLCRGEADAEFIEQKDMLATLLRRPGECDHFPIRIVPIPGATYALAMGANAHGLPAAKMLRAEITSMAQDQTLDRLCHKWLFDTADETRIVAELAHAEQRSHLLRYIELLASTSLSCAFLFGFAAYRANGLRRAALAAEKQSRTQAEEDSLTGLANRSVFAERLRSRMAFGPRERAFAVMFLDLDLFKVINDSLGHLAGDQLLVEIGRRLEHAVRSTDLVGRLNRSCTARLGGDEFAVLLEDVNGVESARRIAERIQSKMSLPYTLDSRTVFTTFSIGVAVSNDIYDSAEDILRDADIAMYVAKKSGRARYAIFEPAMRAKAIARLEIETDLRQALKSRQLAIHYLPEVDLSNGKIKGFEALLRWPHPKYGYIPPLDFIPIAEETGLIASLSAWVLEEACCQARQWQSKFPDVSDLKISVNISGKYLGNGSLFPDIVKALDSSCLQPNCLDLEITESVLMDDIERTIDIFHELKCLGVGLRIDDFGTGYSSLSYLHRLPFDTLKIDRSFVHSMDKEDGLEIVRTIMSLAQNLKMQVVAEGVETEAQLARLRALGCGLAQGNLFMGATDPVSAERRLATQSHAQNGDAISPPRIGTLVPVTSLT